MTSEAIYLDWHILLTSEHSQADIQRLLSTIQDWAANQGGYLTQLEHRPEEALIWGCYYGTCHPHTLHDTEHFLNVLARTARLDITSSFTLQSHDQTRTTHYGGLNEARQRFMSGRRHYQQAMSRLLPPGMHRPFAGNPYATCNSVGLEFLKQHKANNGTGGYNCHRPADSCMHHRPHACFHPTGEPLWVRLTWYRPLQSAYLPLRELQPDFIRDPCHARLCCAEATYLLAKELVHQEAGTEMQLTRLDTEETEDIDDYADRFFGLKPCWGS